MSFIWCNMLNKNRKKDKWSYAVSEILGTVVLLAIAVGLFSIIYLTLSSSLLIQESPQVNIVGYVDGNNLILEHLGGSSLDSSVEFLVTIGGQQQTFSLDTIEFSDTNLNEKWDIGEQVNYSSSRIGGVYSVVASVRDTASNKLLFNGLLKEGINDDQDEQEAPLIVYVSNDFDELTEGWGYDHFNDLQQGIDSVAETGIIYLLNGIYEGDYNISKPLSLIGESMYQTIIDANEEISDGYVIIESTEDVLLSTFTIRNGYIIPEEDDEDEGIYAAVMSQNSTNITVTNLVIHDVNTGYASVEDISDIEVGNLIVYNCSIGVGIRNGTSASYTDIQVYDCNIGVFIVDTDSSNVIFENNTINNTFAGIYFVNSNNTVVRNNIIQNSEVFGILFDFETESYHNMIYNNKFVNNSVHVKDDYLNQYNITKTSGTNIIGGSFIAGNYYDNYAGLDIDDDGIGDTDLPYTSNGSIVTGGDYQPLTLQATFSPVSNWKMDENSGCIARDTYGDNNGTLEPNCPGTGPQWTQGISNTALLFDGDEDYILVDDAPNLNPITNMTIAAWVKWTIDPNSGKSWASIVNKGGNDQYRLQHNIDNSLFEFGIQTARGGRHLRSTTAPIQDLWYYVVGTYDGETIKIYVNGTLENSITWSGSIAASSSPLFIGRYSDGGRNFNGIIDEVSFYNRSLSIAEIQALYLQTRTQVDQNNTLIAHWKFNEAEGAIANDTSGNENHGTINTCIWKMGVNGSALYFNGVNSNVYSDRDGHPELDPVMNITVMAWVKNTDLDNNYMSNIIGRSGGSDGYSYRLYLNDGSSYDNLGVSIRTQTGGIQSREWTWADMNTSWFHLAMTFSNENEGTLRLYHNGVEIGNWDTIGQNLRYRTAYAGDDLYIGSGYQSTSNYFKGLIDDVRIYNATLTSSDIIEIFDQTRPTEDQPISIWYFNENTGSLAYDSMGGNDGSIIGPTWTTGVNGSALYFDGVNDYVEVPDHLSLDPIELTLMAWIKHGSTLDHRCIIDKRDDVQDGYNLYISPSGNAWVRINDNTLTGTSDIDDDVWHHIACTYDGSTIRIYVDGVEENSDSIGSELLDTINSLRIGLERDNGFDFNGIIDDARIYNYALSTQEIAEIYNSTKPSEDDDEIAMWEFNENTGTIAYDSIGENNGDIDSATWTQGISGSALSFNAAQDSSVNIAYDDSLALSQNFSISFWIYPTSSTVQWRTFLTRQSQFTCSYIGGNKIRIHINGYTNIDSQSAAPRNSWTHVVFTLEDTNIGDDIIRLYINGELDGQIGPVWGTHFSPTNPLFIGGDGSSSYYTGRLDDIRIYNRALTTEEVILLYNQ